MNQNINPKIIYPNLKLILVAKPRGFCAGVERAINIVEKALDIHSKPIYIKHQIVHNTHITQRLANKGAITIENIESVPNNSTIIFSAHGSPPRDFKIAKQKNLKIIDAICPLVLKVHLAVKNLNNQNYKIIYIGNKNHMEAKGVKAQNPEIITIIENENDIDSLPLELKTYDQNEKLACLTQTTLNREKTIKIIEKLKQKYPNIHLQNSTDICYATTNRQNAVKEIEKQADLMLIIGSPNSSNTNKLLEIAKLNQKPSYLIEDLSEIKPEWINQPNIKTIGISSGASVPEDLVQEILTYFKNQNIQIKEINVIEENIKFPLPKELKIISKI